MDGGICKYCILFPEQQGRGGMKGAKPNVLVLAPYLKTYSKALGKDGVLTCHEESQMHCDAAIRQL